MQILQAEQNKISPVYLELNEYQKTLEEVLKINTNKEYKKNILSILDEINHKINELSSIFLMTINLYLK